MLSYKIQAKTLSTVKMALENVDRGSRPPNSTPLLVATYQSKPPISWVVPWSKLEFTYFVEEVKKIYKVGDIVTLSVATYQEGKLPPLYKITYISELINSTQFDTSIREPVLLTLSPLYGGVAFGRCKAQVRHLNKEEQELVKLSNTKPVGVA